MSISQDFTELIEKRKGNQDDIDYESNPVISAMIQLLTQNIDQTVQFLNRDCSEEQLIWLSEVMDEVAEITKSKEFIAACYQLVDRYPATAQKYNIKFFIDSAAEYVE